MSLERFSQAISTWDVQSEVKGNFQQETRQRVLEALWRVYGLPPLPPSHRGWYEWGAGEIWQIVRAYEVMLIWHGMGMN